MATLTSTRLAVRALTRVRSAVGVRSAAALQNGFMSSASALPNQGQLCLLQARLHGSRQFSVSSALLGAPKFTKDHEWVSLSGKTATIGITDYAQDHLGDLVYVSLPEVGDKFFAGDEFGTVESVKAASELLCPIVGEVIDINPELEDQPELINKSCYDKGWLIKLKVKDIDSQLEQLLTEEQYKEFLQTLV